VMNYVSSLNSIYFGEFNMFERETFSVLKIRAKLLHAARCCFDQNGYVEGQGCPAKWPIISYRTPLANRDQIV